MERIWDDDDGDLHTTHNNTCTTRWSGAVTCEMACYCTPMTWIVVDAFGQWFSRLDDLQADVAGILLTVALNIHSHVTNQVLAADILLEKF